jgi:beta-phosphoglucomutase family hydrolase
MAGYVIDLAEVDAFLFDLDGILTRTQALHAAAWKRLFDEYLAARAAREGQPFTPFDIEQDYLRYVDGKPRYAGVRSFLQSRGIPLPPGSPRDGPDVETMHGLGNRKDRYFEQLLQERGVETYETSVAFVREVRSRGAATAVVSSSKNTTAVLRAVRLTSLFDARVDGVERERLGLPGKPAPDTFLEAARRLGIPPGRAVVFEDALAGVEAGRRGGFGLVVGVDRAGQREALLERGADVVVADLGELRLRGRSRPTPAVERQRGR